MSTQTDSIDVGDAASSALGRVRRTRSDRQQGVTTGHDTGHQQRGSAQLLRQADELAEEAAHLKTLAVAFERWHQDMITLIEQHRQMQGKGEDLTSIVKQLIILSLNAAVEAARSDHSAKGFVVVAAEVRRLAMGAQALSGDLSKSLQKSDLMTTATFQDIQAGGKLMLAAISGLESRIQQLRAGIG